MILNWKKIFFIVLAAVSAVSQSAADDRLGVCAIQLEVDEALYSSEEAFYSGITAIMDEEVAGKNADLVIFPEYTGVFFELIGILPPGVRYEGYQDAFASIAEETGLSSINDVFCSMESSVEKYIKFWSGLSAERGVFIITGSLFFPDGGRVTNRSLVFGPDGSLVYFQDKVFLTDFEKDILNLSSGNIEDAGSFFVKNRRISLTICRDTYFDVWEKKHRGTFLWVDIKANGQYFTKEQRRSFYRALPSRLAGSGAVYGLTVCLTGGYLDLFWEGQSSLYKNNGGRPELVMESVSFSGRDSLFFMLPLESDY